MSDETVIFEKADPKAQPEEPVSPYYVVQIWRPSQDLFMFATQGANPRWENYKSSADRAEAEALYMEAAQVYARVRLVEINQEVVDV